ncbi:hypothetical protein F443_03320 [Phytophthora nicotianae P1569]|uniref:Uncharacterized protein n=1 Tax=Phytophthora nicotianae P1569 TaxID=1317065 RepID=V9FSL3_PHYNI|nr:hypothetical protein F443_03320 [Phytophthora nicotianae P1569]
MDLKLCALLNLAVYIGSTSKVMGSEFLYGKPEDGDRVVMRFLTDTAKNQAFQKMNAGKLGTHSLHNGAATYATGEPLTNKQILG